MNTIVITIAGGSASGKTTVVEKIMKTFGNDVVRIPQDDYYKDQEHMTMEERLEVNYDHPFSMDNELLVSHINTLLKGKSIEKPTYDFTNYTRSKEVEILEPRKVIIVEGILVLDDINIRNLSDIKIFVEADDDLRFIRRMKRDIEERGRTIDSVVEHYLTTVKPMHYQFVKPTKRYADIIVPSDSANDVAVDLIITKMKSILES